MVRRATGIDSLLLGLESPTVHYHTLKMGIVDASAEPQGYSHELIRERLLKRLHLLPPFRWKLLPSPLGLAHPIMVEDPNFDIDRHIKTRQVPPPGDLRAMCRLISEEASLPLDRRRPLWELCLLEGLEGGRVGFLLKIHHAIADGMANVLLMQQVFVPERNTDPVVNENEWKPDKVPLWLSRLGSDLLYMPGLWASRIPGLLRARREQKLRGATRGQIDGKLPPSFKDAPPTPWNGLLSARRELACTSLPLADVLAIKSAFEVSVNDVALALVAGALRQYLQGLNALPSRPLVATMPVSTRTEEQMVPWGNHVTAISVALRSDVADPVARLKAGRDASLASKKHFDANRDLDFTGVTDLIPDFILHYLIPHAIRRKVEKGGPSMTGNLSISNVPGPKKPLYGGDSKLESFFSAGMLNEGTGIGVTVWSYAGQFNFSLLACPDLVPDVWEMAAGLELQLDTLLELAQQFDTEKMETN